MIRSNEFHTYFRVNSVFWDPNIYGRYLALVIVVAMAALLWVKERRDLAAADGAGRRPLARPRARPSPSRASSPCWPASPCWRRCAGAWRWTLAAVGVGAVGAVARRHPRRRLGKLNFSTALNIDTSGRANLVSGGVDLFAERPL